MARHRAVSHRSRQGRSPAPPLVPARRLPGIELVDALSGVAHQVTPDETLAGRARGDYEGFCAARFSAASLTDPGRDQCPECAS